MKKVVYIVIGLCAILASCAKEIEQPLAENSGKSEQVTPRNSCIPACITAEYSEPAEEESAQANVAPSTKTSYPGGVFNWVLNDEVAVYYVDDATTPTKQGWYAYKATVLGSGNTTAEFSFAEGQTDKEEAMDGWACAGIAVYPSRAAQPYSGDTIKDLDENYVHKVYVKVPRQVSGEASDIMLIGTTTDPTVSTSFKFRTAMAVLKVTVTNIPAQAKQLRLYTSDKENYPLDGDFLLHKDGDNYCIKSSDYRKYNNGVTHSANDYIYATISTDVAISSRDFYFNIPVGSYTQGAFSLKLVDGNGNALLEKTLNKAFEFKRNDLVYTPALANEWVTLGTGKFHDNFYLDSYKLTSWNWADVTIQQNIANTNQYRIVDPYKAYSTANSYSQPSASDAYLVFTVNKTSGLVQFEDCFTGIRFTYDYTISYNKWNGTANEGPSYNKVIASSSGEPTCIQLAPYYCWKDKTNGYSKYNVNGLIMIEFPDYDTSISPVSSSLATSLSPEVSLSGNNLSKFNVGFGASDSAAISAIDNTEYNAEAPASITIPSDGIATYYVAFKPTYSSGRTLSAKAYPFYTLSTTAASTYAKQFSGAFIMSYQLGDVGANTITFAVSDNPFKGNIMITEFDGLSYDVSENTHAAGNSTGFYDGADFSQFSDGNPVYGYYNGSSSYPNTTFYNVMDQVFYYDANGSAHYIVGDSVNTNPASGGTLTDLKFAFGSSSTYYRSTVYPVVCWSRWIGNYWKLGNSAGYDYELFQYGAAAQ